MHPKHFLVLLAFLEQNILLLECQSNRRLLSTTEKRKVFVFSTTNKNYKYYDWMKIDTLVECGYHDSNLVNFAHSKNASVVYLANFATDILYSRDKIAKWVEEQVNYAKSKKLDGVNVDYEEEMNCTDTAAIKGFNNLMQRLVDRFRAVIPQAQISIDLAWSPDNIDNRCYDYKTLGHIADYSILMMYSLRSQVSPDLPCLAWANAAYNSTLYGLKQFLALRINRSKLIFGVPWYGYDYECIYYNDKTDECTIGSLPFRGCNCSDAVGSSPGYSSIQHLLKFKQIIEPHVMWDPVALSPYFSYKADDGKVHQIWYDDPRSLTYKYRLAQRENLRGVVMWEADSLNYTNASEMRKYVREMWAALP